MSGNRVEIASGNCEKELHGTNGIARENGEPAKIQVSGNYKHKIVMNENCKQLQ